MRNTIGLNMHLYAVRKVRDAKRGPIYLASPPGRQVMGWLDEGKARHEARHATPLGREAPVAAVAVAAVEVPHYGVQRGYGRQGRLKPRLSTAQEGRYFYRPHPDEMADV